MFLVSLTVGGIDICYAAEVTFVSPLYLQLGVPINLMTMCWMISPVLGFFLVPILGGASDSCRSRLGKRRPFIILYSAGIALGLMLVSYGNNIGMFFGDGEEHLYSLHKNTSNHYTSLNSSEVNEGYPQSAPTMSDHTIGKSFCTAVL